MRRRSVFLGWLALAALALVILALAQEEAAKPTQIVLRPAKAPVPALKYQLLPERRTLVPGNAAIFYHRAVEVMLDKYSSEREQRAGKQNGPCLRRREVARRLAGWSALGDSPRTGAAIARGSTAMPFTKSSWGPGGRAAIGSSINGKRAFPC